MAGLIEVLIPLFTAVIGIVVGIIVVFRVLHGSACPGRVYGGLVCFPHNRQDPDDKHLLELIDGFWRCPLIFRGVSGSCPHCVGYRYRYTFPTGGSKLVTKKIVWSVPPKVEDAPEWEHKCAYCQCRFGESQIRSQSVTSLGIFSSS